ncbi:MAG TPA: DUF92 domain-containing protein [Candidatus Acidoferrales bacterium]|nr:DUF92 domain-containing protein [Candidatus Acidoferrales bacterium]
MSNAALGVLLALVVSAVAWRAHALTLGGAVAAFCVGSAVFAALGLGGAVVLLAFFVSSVGLSRWGRAHKRELVDVGKHGPRDALQVLANGGVAALCALCAVAAQGEAARWSIAFAGAFAAATADTWATEIGTLGESTPRSILTGKPIARGLSGGVTLMGTAAEVAGASFIALAAQLCGLHAFGVIAAAGVAGAVVDSLLGATLQSLRWCPDCSRACETNPHHCGSATTPLRGFSWFGNDLVNFGATVTGAAVAFLIAN